MLLWQIATKTCLQASLQTVLLPICRPFEYKALKEINKKIIAKSNPFTKNADLINLITVFYKMNILFLVDTSDLTKNLHWRNWRYWRYRQFRHYRHAKNYVIKWRLVQKTDNFLLNLASILLKKLLFLFSKLENSSFFHIKGRANARP